MVIDGNLNAFGLDICDDSAKVVQLKQERTFRGKSRLFLCSYGEIKFPKGIVSNGEIISLEELSSYISELLKQTKIKNRAVVASLPEKKSFLQLLEISARNEKNLEEGLPKIIENHLPVAYKEIYADWQIISKKDETDGLFKYKILIGAVLRKTSDSITELLTSLNLMPIALEIEGVAIARSALRLAPVSMSKNYAILDIGSNYSSIIFARDGIPALSLDVPVSGNAMTKIIADSLKLPTEEAEKTKIKCGLDLKLCKEKLRPVLSCIIDDVTQKIKKAIIFYETHPSKKITNIYLSGGGANLSKLDSVLSQKLKIKVRRCDPTNNIIHKNPLFQKQGPKYTTAIGLAIRGTMHPFV